MDDAEPGLPERSIALGPGGRDAPRIFVRLGRGQAEKGVAVRGRHVGRNQQVVFSRGHRQQIGGKLLYGCVFHRESSVRPKNCDVEVLDGGAFVFR